MAKVNAEELKANRTKVQAAFNQLRKRRILAHSNFMCCQGCGHSVLSQRAKKELKVGWVFWHSQDADALKKNGLLSIAFGGIQQKSSLKIGQALVEELMKQGLKVSWDWNDENRPEVLLANVED